MTTIDRTAKRRARRIAADEAHSWARNLRLCNHHAKMVLMCITLYVDGDGFCWVSIPSLAEDCELSADTVRRRLVWLEEIGALARVPQWIDESGRRNSDARGKRTSDLIRLLVDADQVAIEAKARGETIEETTAFSPSSQLGVNPAQPSVSPRLGLGQPSQSGEGLISEPEPEPETPKVPGGDEREPISIGEVEPEHFAPAWQAWPGHEAMRRDLALEAFRELPPDKQLLCRAAVPLFAQALNKLGRTKVPNFHLWIRQRGFDEFPSATLATTAGGETRRSVEANGTEGRAIVAMYAVGRARPFEIRGQVVYPHEITPQVLAFGEAGPPSSWQWIEDRQQIGAWSAFLAEYVIGARAPLIQSRGLGEAQRSGIYAPWPWPPRKDGTQSQATGDAA